MANAPLPLDTNNKPSQFQDAAGLAIAPKLDANGNLPVAFGAGAPSGAVTIADGASVTQGAIGDVAVTGDNPGTLSAKLRGILKQLVVQLPAALGANGGLKVEGIAVGQPIPTGGTTIEASSVFTRVADGNAYAAGDCISSAVTDTGTTPLLGITVAGANGGTGYVTKIRVATDQTTCVAQLRLHFYTKNAPTVAIPGDNLANITSYGNFAQSIGYVDLPAFVPEAGTNTAVRTQDLTTRLAFACDPADTKIYYRLATQTAFTPASAQSFSIAISSERNAT